MTLISALRAQRILLAVVAILAAGCTTNSKITHSYVDPQLIDNPYKGVLVVAVAQQNTSRVEFEDEFTSALQRHGVQAIASHTLLPSHKTPKEQVIAAAQKANLDTILVTRYVGKSAEEIYHPGTVYYGIMPVYADPINRGPFGPYYGHAVELGYDQPVWSTNTTYTLISDLFVTETKEHMWQAVSDTIKASSTGALRRDIIKGFVRNMKDSELLD